MNENTINSLFVKATSKGPLAVEDLWDLSLQSLDSIAVSLDEQIQKQGRKSFIGAQPKEAEELQDRFEITKFVIETKLAEQAAAKTAAETEKRVEFLKGLLQKKEIERLEGQSEEDIRKQLAELGITA